MVVHTNVPKLVIEVSSFDYCPAADRQIPAVHSPGRDSASCSQAGEDPLSRAHVPFAAPETNHLRNVALSAVECLP